MSSLTTLPWWPFAVLLISVAFVIVAISRLKLHPFLALLAAAVLAGGLCGRLTEAKGKPEMPKGQWLLSVEQSAEEFGKTAGKISIVIGMATLIGMSMMRSGAADKVVRRFLAAFGEKRAGGILLVSTYFLSIPIFFDTMFMLMVPIAMALALRTGGKFSLYVLAICSAGVMTHSMTVPHPGPIAIVEGLHLDSGLSLFAGIAVGALVIALSWPFVRWLAAKNDVPLRETPSAPLASLRGLMDRPESELPSLLGAIIPVVLPIALISLKSFWDISAQTYAEAAAKAAGGTVETWAAFSQAGWFKSARYAVEFIGDKNVALTIGAALSLWLLVRQKGLSMETIMNELGPPLETAGIIILITSAGGAFGGMIAKTGVGDAIKAATAGQNISILLLAWAFAAVMRIAQGSATVAMQTTAPIIYGLIGAAALPFHPMYCFLAIGFGAFACSWMNDSGFWVVSRLGGFTERETLRTWTVLLTVNSIIGLIVTLVLSKVLPCI